MTDRERLGSAVAKVREARGLSRVDLALKLYTDSSTVDWLEAGHDIGIRLGRVAEALDLPKQVLALLAVDPSELPEVDRKITESLIELAWSLVTPGEKAA